MAENPLNDVSETIGNGVIKDITNVLKKSTTTSYEDETIGTEGSIGSTSESTFKVVGTNLPEKTGFWTKVKNVLLYEIKVELTPKQQKVEDEINEFLHQEVTWQSFKNFLFQEVPITYKGKRVF